MRLNLAPSTHEKTESRIMKEKYEINGGALARTWAPAKLTVP
jgi:hypothetical protein